jgi:hypothetical protein
MQSIEGTYRDGQIQLESPPNWPEGQRVVILPAGDDSEVVRPQPTWGLEESLWPDTPENNAEIVRRMRESEPLVMSDEEYAAWEAERQAMKEYNIACVRKQMGLDP